MHRNRAVEQRQNGQCRGCPSCPGHQAVHELPVQGIPSGTACYSLLSASWERPWSQLLPQETWRPWVRHEGTHRGTKQDLGCPEGQ